MPYHSEPITPFRRSGLMRDVSPSSIAFTLIAAVLDIRDVLAGQGAPRSARP